MNKTDFFDILVRKMAVKPLEFQSFDLETAKKIIKSENEDLITLFGEHGFFENTLGEIAANIATGGIRNGTLYIYIKGEGCSERVKRNIVGLSMNTHRMVIFGDPEKWPLRDPNITFVSPDDLFADNHQRFFVFQSPSYSVALVSRHEMRDGEEKIEAALTTNPEAVSMLAQTIGSKAYTKMN